MITLQDVQNLAEKLLNKDFNIKNVYGKIYTLNAKLLGYTFKFDKAKRRFGCCSYTKKTISLSKHMCEINLNQLEGKINDCILHELAHAFCLDIYGLTDGGGHSNKWVHIAKQIGSNGKKRFSYTDFGGLNKPKSKYTLTCPTCKNETPIHRKIKRTFACSLCCVDGYDPKHKLILTQNY